MAAYYTGTNCTCAATQTEVISATHTRLVTSTTGGTVYRGSLRLTEWVTVSKLYAATRQLIAAISRRPPDIDHWAFVNHQPLRQTRIAIAVAAIRLRNTHSPADRRTNKRKAWLQTLGAA